MLNENDQHIYMNWYYSYADSLSRRENVVGSCDKALNYISSLSEPY